MKAPALLILLLLPSLALAQQSYYGTTAISIGLPSPADPADTAVLTIHYGDIITPENIRSSIQALYDTGHYRTIEVNATAGPDGTQISFNVTAQYYFSTFRLEPEDLLERPITSYLPPPLGKKFSTVPVERLVSDTEKLIEEAGYFNATISPEYSFDDQTRLVTVILRAKTGMKRAKIQSIQIDGGQKILSDAVLNSALKVSKGDDFNAGKIEKGVDSIRQKFVDKGYLTAKVRSDQKYDPVMNVVDLIIEVDPGRTTTVQVYEAESTKPEIPEKTLRTLVPIYEEGTVDSDLVDEGRKHIVAHYQQQGYFDASVTGKVTEGADKSVQVQYFVAKGQQHWVRAIRIEGSAFFPEADILKKMKTREGKSGSHGLFSPDLLAADIRMIEAMYRNAGFQSTTVSHSDPESEDHNIEITIHIHEGLRSTLGNIIFSGNQSFTEPELWRASGIQSDQVYSSVIIDNARDALAALYYSHGFSDIRIETHLDFDSIYNTVDVRFDITEGPQYRIGWIVVSGNTHTAEKVITRSSKLQPMDPYDPEAILEAQQRLYALGIFNRVDIVPIDQDVVGNYKIILIQVEDAKPILLTPGFGVTEIVSIQPTSTVNLTGNGPGGAFSTIGPRATIEVSDNNLFGLNRTLSFRIRGGYHEAQVQSSYRDPRLLNHDLEGIASASFDKSEHRCGPGCFYKAHDFNMALRVVRQLSKIKTLSFAASYNTVHLQDIRSNPNANKIQDTGTIQIARLQSSLLREKRDSAIDPTRGTFTTTDVQVASKVWGSEVNFVSFFNQTSYYTPVHGGVIATSARLGWKQPYGSDNLLPVSERFFAGGSTTLRGFRLNDAGPTGGGELMTIANLEYRVPIPFFSIKSLGGALFYDTGNVFEHPWDFALSEFTHSVGAGLRYKTPLGPIRTDVGFNLRAKSNERKYVVFFTLGHAF